MTKVIVGKFYIYIKYESDYDNYYEPKINKLGHSI